MVESTKIMNLINKWGYLSADQISILLNKHIEAVKMLLRNLNRKNMIKIDNTTRKNYYMLTHKGNSYLGREHKKTIRINYNEIPHQATLIKWLLTVNHIIDYKTERELKIDNGNLKSYPDLLITTDDEIEIYIEFERTRKSPTAFQKKIDGHYEWLKNGKNIIWIVPNQTLANWIKKQLDHDNYCLSQQNIIIFDTNK